MASLNDVQQAVIAWTDAIEVVQADAAAKAATAATLQTATASDAAAGQQLTTDTAALTTAANALIALINQVTSAAAARSHGDRADAAGRHRHADVARLRDDDTDRADASRQLIC